jgi:hypothetical protein
MRRLLLATLLLFASALAVLDCAGQVTRFQVLKADELVGNVIAMRMPTATGTVYTMTSHCELDIIWSQVVRTSLRTEYTDGALTSCHTSLRVNDAVRDSSSMVKGMGQCFVHPKTAFTCTRATQWTTSRMYFEEPLGQPIVFVESVLQDCPLVRSAPGIYTLTFPNGNVNHYVYKAGLLQEIRVDRSFFDLVFRRA